MSDRIRTLIDQSEHARLDAAIGRADELLVDSLRREEGRRMRRRNALLLAGGLAMTATVVCALLVAFAGRDADANRATTAVAATKPAAAEVERARALSAEGWRLWQQQRPAEAEAKFVEAVHFDPTLPHAWNGLGWSRFNQAKAADAIEPFEKAIALEPDHAGAANGLGQVYLAEGKLEAAERPLLTAAANDATAAFWGLAKLYLLRGDYDRALPWTLLIVRESPGDPDARAMLEAARARKLDDKLRRQIEPAKKA
jgi:Flp pilus assembly protein TadD